MSEKLPFGHQDLKNLGFEYSVRRDLYDRDEVWVLHYTGQDKSLYNELEIRVDASAGAKPFSANVRFPHHRSASGATPLDAILALKDLIQRGRDTEARKYNEALGFIDWGLSKVLPTEKKVPENTSFSPQTVAPYPPMIYGPPKIGPRQKTSQEVQEELGKLRDEIRLHMPALREDLKKVLAPEKDTEQESVAILIASHAKQLAQLRADVREIASVFCETKVYAENADRWEFLGGRHTNLRDRLRKVVEKNG